MALFRSRRSILEAIASLNSVNPFVAQRTEWERRALGQRFVDAGDHWAEGPDYKEGHPNLALLLDDAETAIRQAREDWAQAEPIVDQDLRLYEDLVLFALYHRYRFDFTAVIDDFEGGKRGKRVGWYERFAEDATEQLHPQGRDLPSQYQPEHLFAFFFQLRRAFHHIFRHLIGASPAAMDLRASVWESIFTHDLRRYARVLFPRMGDLSTLVTGPSGTGKELVARAIGLSGYIPFEVASRSFQPFYGELFHALDLSAMSPTLIESELFGHKKGAFTGALADRKGWLEISHRLGTVFLDELGEIEPAVQVKLLRVLETRRFQRLGDREPLRFEGKVICATNRDLATEISGGRFRADLYYRICSDRIQTPTLAKQLAEKPDELEHLVRFVARRLVGDEAEELTGEVTDWIDGHLGRTYSWPGNFRELEQCVRNVLVRREYHPPRAFPKRPSEQLAVELQQGSLTAEQLLRKYCQWVYTKTGSYEAAARVLGLDRRTVKAKVHSVPDTSSPETGDEVSGTRHSPQGEEAPPPD